MEPSGVRNAADTEYLDGKVMGGHATDDVLGTPFPNDTAASLSYLRDFGIQLSVGRYSYGVPQIYYAAHDPKARLTIGSFCSIGGNCQIFIGKAARHYTDFVTTHPLTMVFGPIPGHDRSAVTEGDLSVWIGSDVWFGVDVVVMAGVRIGHGAVIGARSVVTSDVEPYTIVGGVPAKGIRSRFHPRIAQRLLALEWWNWPDRLIKDSLPLFYTRDMEVALNQLEEIGNQLSNRPCRQVTDMRDAGDSERSSLCKPRD